MSTPPINDQSDQNRDSWSRYWALQPDHSLPGTFDASYGQAISSFWREAADQLEIKAAVLDLATGNGALPRLLLNNRPDLRIDAIDAAEIAPAWVTPAEAIRPRFHSNVRCEELPFDAACFDLVTSQYGVEYSNWDLSLAEVARVLRPGGIFAAIMHSDRSRITLVTREEAAHVELLTGVEGPLEQVLKMAELMPLAATSEGRQQLNASTSAKKIRQNFNASMSDVQLASQRSFAPDLLLEFLHWVPELLAAAGHYTNPSVVHKAGQRYRTELGDVAERYRALLCAALDAPAQDKLKHLLVSMNLQPTSIQEIEQDGYPLGIALTARKL